VVRSGVATPLRTDTVLQEGDKVIAIGRADCERLLHEQLIGQVEEAGA
jgi:K+/H+ antiporter YhaU regulatory subunit KhtT